MQLALWRCCSVCPFAEVWCFSACMRVVLLRLAAVTEGFDALRGCRLW